MGSTSLGVVRQEVDTPELKERGHRHPPRPEVAPHSRDQGELVKDKVELRELSTRLLFNDLPGSGEE